MADAVSPLDDVMLYIQRLSSQKADKLVNRIHAEAFSRINCLQCANCCKTTSPLFTQEDIGRISAVLGMTRSEFIREYLVMDEDGDFVFNRPAPCPFLDKDNLCRVYEARPQACREYPHTAQAGQRKILPLTKKNAAICPGVHDILMRIKAEMNG